MGSLTGGRYVVTWRADQWVVRAPDSRTAKPFGPTDLDKAKANLWADRANAKLRVVDPR